MERHPQSPPALWTSTVHALTRVNSQAALLVLPLALAWNALRLQHPEERLLFLTGALLSPLLLLKAVRSPLALTPSDYLRIDATIIGFALLLLFIQWRVADPALPSGAYAQLLASPLYYMRWAVVYAHTPARSWSLSGAYLLIVTAGVTVPYLRGHTDLDPLTVLLLGALTIFTGHDISRATRQLDAERTHRQAAQQLSQRDPLTDLPNRRAFDEDRLTLNPAERHSLILLDIDHFKRVNDDHGHDVGDQVLRALATRLARLLDARGVTYRWGGEEFAVLLPLDPEDAAAAAEDLRRGVEERPLRGQRVTVSLGVGPFRPGPEAQTDFNRVDDALRRAKVEGRNQVRRADGPPHRPPST